MAYRYFISTGWGGTGTPASLPSVYDDDENLLAAYYYTLDQALNAAVAGDAVSPAPPNTPGCAFLDAFGKPLKTVVVSLGASVTINKTITLEGGAYRLRLDGGGVYWIRASAATSFIDCDIVRLNGNSGVTNALRNDAGFLFKRCLVAGFITTIWHPPVAGNPIVAEDSVFFGCKATNYDANVFPACTATRCVLTVPNNGSSSLTDCINLYNMSADQISSIGFAAAPKVGNFANRDYNTDGTQWSMNDWESADLMLLPTSPYATGNSLTSASGSVYDLDGNKRKIGGALGAYEVLGATRTARAQERGWSYTYEKENDSAPDVAAVAIYPAESSSYKFLFRAKFPGARDFYVSNDGAYYTTLQYVVSGYAQSLEILRSFRWIKARTASGDATIIRLYSPDDTAPDGAIPCAADFNCPKTWEEEAAPGDSDVCYIGSNGDFITTTGEGASKIIVPGWTRPNLGNVPAVDPEIGLDSVLTTRGAITLTNRTATSAEILTPFDPRSGARITFKDCAISD